MGTYKTRVMPEDITINIGESAVVPVRSPRRGCAHVCAAAPRPSTSCRRAAVEPLLVVVPLGLVRARVKERELAPPNP